MPSNRITIGNVELVSLSDGNGDRDPVETFPDSTRERWAEYPELLDADGHAQAHYTDWNPVFDIDPIQSRKTCHGVIDRLEAEGPLVSAGHFPHPGLGRFVRREGRRVWQGM